MDSLIRLTDVQLVLLAGAVRSGGWLSPPPDIMGHGPARIRREVDALMVRGLAKEGAVSKAADAWRHNGQRAIGVAITSAGRELIGLPEPEDAAIRSRSGVTPIRASTTKSQRVLQLLRRDAGVTMDELVIATGWQAHSGRAALAGLRKRGHPITRTKREGVSCYKIDKAA